MGSNDFKCVQASMAAHLRDPDYVAGPSDVEPRRVKIYQDLIFNNIEGFIAGAFPVLRELYKEQEWLALMREFVRKHHSHSPYFLHISQEFLQFLQTEFEPRPCDPPFMLELAHYEWVELALDVSEAEAVDGSSLLALSDTELLASLPRVSPLAWPLVYQYPVHQVSAEHQPQQVGEQNSFLLVYRQREQVRFIESNGPTIRLLLLLSEQNSPNLEQCLQVLATEMQHPQAQQLHGFACEIVRDLASKSILSLA
ncbi:MAG: putative DNA-binding domain-containing protein [Cellvibrionaceae bacterium]|nr:putative DNA-binding domain-containing protein [Cellvibrionaceae bacterium]